MTDTVETTAPRTDDFLSQSEVERLTGKKSNGGQSKELNFLGIPFRARSDGKPVVHRSDLPLTRNGQLRQQPNLLVDPISPEQLFDQSFRHEIQPVPKILEKPYTPADCVSRHWRTMGVYFLLQTKGNCVVVVYVGLAQSIGPRLKRHIDEKRKLFDSVAVMPYENRMYLDTVENAFIQHLEPHYNAKYPPLCRETKKVMDWLESSEQL